VNVHLHIDRVVLDGVSIAAADRAQFRVAVERELAGLLRRGGIAHEVEAASSLASVRATPISIAPAASAADVGRSVASSVFRGIGGRP